MPGREGFVLITGGAGFIGSHLAAALGKRGVPVRILDNFSTGTRENLEAVGAPVDLVEGDICDEDVCGRAVSGCDTVIHQAYPYGVATRDVDHQYVAEGAIGTFNVLRAALRARVRKVLYASTVAVYGRQERVPVDEEHPKNPFLPYGATKYLGELYCSTFANVYGLDTASCRYFNVYGPRYATYDHSALILFMERALRGEDLLIYGDGTQMRDYTYIDDVVTGTLLALDKPTKPGDVYNIGAGRGLTIKELADLVVKSLGSRSKVRLAEPEEYRKTPGGLPYGITDKKDGRFLDTRKYMADITKARRDLGYNPTTPLEEGIPRTLAWLKGKLAKGDA